MKKIPLSILFLSLLLSASLFAADWPQFKQTPNRQGCSLTERVTLPSKLCAWFNFNSPIIASPVIVSGKAYAISSKGLLARIDLATNKIDWRVSLGGVGNESSPSVVGGKVYVGTKTGKLFVLDASTGAEIKQYDAGSPIFASPLVLDSGVYFGSLNAKFHALDLNGNLKWTYQAKNNIIHSAASDSGCIVFCDGNKLLYRFRDLGSTYGVVYISHILNWATTSPSSAAPPSGDPFLATPMIWNNGIFVGRGNQEYGGGSHQLTRINFSTGEYNVTSGPCTGVFTTPSVDTSTHLMYIGSNNSGLFALRNGIGTWPDWTTNGQYYESTGVWGVNSSPAVVANCLIFGSEQGEVHFFQKDTLPYGKGYGGVQFWSYKTTSGKAFNASPAVSEGKVIIGSLDGCLYGFWNGTEVSSSVTVDTVHHTNVNDRQSPPGVWTLTASPNPSPGGSIAIFSSSHFKDMTLSILDTRGREIRRLIASGSGIINWNLMNFRNQPVAPGAYVAILKNRAHKTIRTVRLVVMR